MRIAQIKKGTITEMVAGYGSVIPAPGTVQIISVPYESQVQAIFVSAGEEVAAGDRLLEIAPSPDTKLALEIAEATYQVASKGLRQAKERFALKLARTAELLQAEQAFQEAKLRLESLKERGADTVQVARAKRSGVVSRNLVRKGAVAAPGSPLMEIISAGAAEVSLGFEPEDAAFLKPGQKVSLAAVDRPHLLTIAGKIRAISRLVDPSSRLLQVFVSLPPPPGLMLNEYVKGTVAVTSEEALLVPRSAVLPQGDQFILFTVNNGRARAHSVTVILETKDAVAVSGDRIAPGERVVILGNYELKDGMAVRVEGSR